MVPSRSSARVSRCTAISDPDFSNRRTNSAWPMSSLCSASSSNASARFPWSTRASGSTVATGLDFVVGDLLLVEIKAVECLLPVHQAQVLTYLKLTQFPAALLVNFNAVTLATGLRRLTRKKELLLPDFPSSC